MNVNTMKLVLSKNAPHIAVGFGVAAVVTSTVLCCRATLKVEDILEEAHDKFAMIKAAREDENLKDTYTEEDFHRDMIVQYVKSGVQFLKLYGPPIALGIAGIASIMWSHVELGRRNTALMGAYALLSERFNAYRERTQKALEGSVEAERAIFDGVDWEKKTIKEKDDEGNVQKKEVITRILSTLDGDIPEDYLSEYAWVFCPETTRRSMNNYADDLYYLQLAEHEMNDRLQAHGHVFLNEVYERLGLDHTPEGAVVGWVLKEDEPNDVNFGIYDGKTTCMRRLQDGLTYCGIAMDFNVDGIIYDLI